MKIRIPMFDWHNNKALEIFLEISSKAAEQSICTFWNIRKHNSGIII